MATTRGGSGGTLPRFEVKARAVQTITLRDDVSVTLFVEKGSVEVIEDLSAKPAIKARLQRSGGPVDLGSGPIHVRNSGKTSAVVFATFAPSVSEVPPSVAEPIARGAFADLALPHAAAEEDAFQAICDVDGNLGGPTTEQQANQRRDAHMALPKNKNCTVEVRQVLL
jgi:hypothetical protein